MRPAALPPSTAPAPSLCVIPSSLPSRALGDGAPAAHDTRGDEPCDGRALVPSEGGHRVLILKASSVLSGARARGQA